MSLKCIAIDDEPMALEIITSFCQRYGNIELTTFNNPLRGMDQVRRSRPDILFLDIEMGDLNGVELARDLPPGTLLIFTTAYAQYALDGFELSAVDFLHKPFSYHRFEKAVQKAIELHKLQELSAHPSFTDESITLKAEYKNVQIKLKDVLYIESMDNYVRIHLTEHQSLMSQTSMKSIQELLPAEKFIRVHKSFIVPAHRIASYTSKEITLYNGTKIPVGRSYSQNLKLSISNN